MPERITANTAQLARPRVLSAGPATKAGRLAASGATGGESNMTDLATVSPATTTIPASGKPYTVAVTLTGRTSMCGSPVAIPCRNPRW